MRRETIAITALLSLGFLTPVHAEDSSNTSHVEETCTAVPPVIKTVYVNVPGPTVNVPGPTVYVNQGSSVRQGPKTSIQTVYVNLPAKPAQMSTHTYYRTRFLPTDKIETIVALSKAEYQINIYKAAYLDMRQKLLNLATSKKKRK
jgi:hypothetical protein